MTEENKNKNLLWLILTIVFAIGAIVITYMYMNTSNELKELQAEKEEQRQMFVAEIDSLLIEHEAIKLDYGELADSLSVKDSLIQANAKEIKNLLNYKWEYYKVNKKLKKLRNISQGYLVQIDSLHKVNETLKGEVIELKQDVQIAKRQNSELKRKSKKLEESISEAAVLSAYNINATAYKVRGSRERETRRARRADKINVCFTLGQNSLLEPGMKKIYIRIADPKNKILTKSDADTYSFDYNGNIMQYSMMEVVDYNNESQEICSTWYIRKSDDISKGRYVVSIFTDKLEIGQTSIVLK